MKEQRITIEIDAEGRISADAEGFSGNLCEKELKKLLEGVAAPWEKVEPKADGDTTRRASRVQPTLKTGKKP